MTPLLVILGLLVALRLWRVLSPSRAVRAAARASGKPRSFAIVGADVIAVDRDGIILHDQSVIVENGRIAYVGPRSTSTSPSAPAGVPVIDGRGKYLIPGLTDMHVHIAGEHDLALFLASGITTVRNMWGFTTDGFQPNARYRGSDYAVQMLELQREVIAALHGASAGLVAGTDAGNPFVIPGVSLLEELRHLVDAGLSPLEALRAATCNAAVALGRADEAGTVAAGKVADLVLLDANPLEDIGHMRAIAGVAVRGLWLTARELAELRGDRRSGGP